jgi:hypothetical protein
MKLAIVSLALFGLMGCATTHSLPPENYGITETVSKKPAREVTVKPIQELPKFVGTPVDDNPYEDADEVAKLSAEQFQALSKAIEEAVKGKPGACQCIQGDPLCECLDTNAPAIKFTPSK